MLSICCCCVFIPGTSIFMLISISGTSVFLFLDHHSFLVPQSSCFHSGCFHSWIVILCVSISGTSVSIPGSSIFMFPFWMFSFLDLHSLCFHFWNLCFHSWYLNLHVSILEPLFPFLDRHSLCFHSVSMFPFPFMYPPIPHACASSIFPYPHSIPDWSVSSPFSAVSIPKDSVPRFSCFRFLRIS